MPLFTKWNNYTSHPEKKYQNQQLNDRCNSDFGWEFTRIFSAHRVFSPRRSKCQSKLEQDSDQNEEAEDKSGNQGV